MMARLADGAAIALAFVFLLSIAEKAFILFARSSSWHPIFLTVKRLRPHAPILFAAALVLEGGAVVTMFVSPRLGSGILMGLLVIYTPIGVAAHRGTPDSDCRCFFKVLNTASTSSLLYRNSILVLVGAAAFGSGVVRFDVVSVGLAGSIVGSLAASISQLDRFIAFHNHIQPLPNNLREPVPAPMARS